MKKDLKASEVDKKMTFLIGLCLIGRPLTASSVKTNRFIHQLPWK